MLQALDYVGVIGVEFFVVAEGGGERLLVNEIAPRVHNSGHWTEDACAVSQFENHIRAIAGWPLGPTARHADVVMTNLIGAEAEDWAKLAAEPDARLHLYGKREARPGRKMGHVTRLRPRAELASPVEVWCMARRLCASAFPGQFMKISGNEIRPGSVIEHEGSLWVAVKSQTVKPGKGPAYNQVELKNLIDGRKLNNRFGTDERVEAAEILRRDFQFLYKEGDMLVFMNTETYEQISLAEDFVGERARLPAGRHDGDGAAARRDADRHLAAAAGDAGGHGGRADDQGTDGRFFLQAGAA